MIGPQPFASVLNKRPLNQIIGPTTTTPSISQQTKKRKPNSQHGITSTPNSSNANNNVGACSGTPSSSLSGSASNRITLEKIIGLTTDANTKLSIHPQTKYVAYCAANVVVCYNPRKNKQYQFLQNTSSNKPFSCLQFSKNGKLLAAGERGSKPAIVVWDVLSGKKVIELKKDGHQYGVSCLAFSNDAKYLVSVGDEHDGTIKLWDLSSNPNSSGLGSSLSSSSSTSNTNSNTNTRGSLVQTIKNIRKTSDVAFSHDGAFFVTVGDKFVKYHHIEHQATNGTIEIKSSRCILGNFKEANFVSVDIVKAKDGTVGIYTVNSDGILCMLNENRQITKWLDMKVKSAFSISGNEDIICCGCSNGIVRLFEPSTLKFKCTLPKPPKLASMSPLNDVDCVACRLLDSRQVVTIYSDRSFFIWDISNLQRIAKYRSFLCHSDSIWDIDLFPENNENLPPGSFITCSSDNTARIWNVEASSTLHVSEKIERGESFISKNVFCKDLLHVIEDKPSNPNGEQGIRSVKFSSSGDHVACGTKQGLIKLFQVSSFTNEFAEVAHEAEILSIDFSTNPKDPSDLLFATSSRDRLIHVFQFKNAQFKLVTSLDDHTASVTSVKFTTDRNGDRYLVSCSADKSIVFRKIEMDPHGEYTFKRYQNCQCNGTIFDLDINHNNDIVTVGQDKKLNVWELDKCKSKQSYKVDTKSMQDTYSPSSEPIRVSFDISGEFVVVSSADKFIRLYNLNNGECIARVSGHSEIITGVKISKDSRRIISVSGDGCIFVWRLAPNIVKLLNKNRPPEISKPKSSLMEMTPKSTVELSVRDTLLPSWAKKKPSNAEDVQYTPTTNNNVIIPSTSKWLASSTEKEFKLSSMEELDMMNDDIEDNTEEEVVYFTSLEQPADFLVSAENKVSTAGLPTDVEDEEDKTTTIKLDPPPVEPTKEDFLIKNYESLARPISFDPNEICDGRISVTSQFLRKAIGKKNKSPKKQTQPLPQPQPHNHVSKDLAPHPTPVISTPNLQQTPSNPIPSVSTSVPSSITTPSNTAVSTPTESNNSKLNLTDHSIPQLSEIPLSLVLKINQISHSFTQALSIIDQLENAENKDTEIVTKSKQALERLMQNMSSTFASRAWQVNMTSTQDALQKYSDMLIEMVKEKLAKQ
ncbi:hypothetical protein C9374_001009 [Naegleria lovaniensis]|uniref:MABP1/WDR62 second WD40 domain-containing protein n=1 Tax=Naegleria lovaniensis TaxID=51637 RepID=A0AA88GYS0_NAELO|nr:uncharacterized protein C9374_001009 [Naegleria lovaniensis]KAG2388159.1 hypothetical protein C9374_001009 [Naegleria lovaniensis]